MKKKGVIKTTILVNGSPWKSWTHQGHWEHYCFYADKLPKNQKIPKKYHNLKIEVEFEVVEGWLAGWVHRKNVTPSVIFASCDTLELTCPNPILKVEGR